MRKAPLALEKPQGQKQKDSGRVLEVGCAQGECESPGNLRHSLQWQLEAVGQGHIVRDTEATYTEAPRFPQEPASLGREYRGGEDICG